MTYQLNMGHYITNMRNEILENVLFFLFSLVTRITMKNTKM